MRWIFLFLLLIAAGCASQSIDHVFTYEPKQCQVEPWNVWYQEGSIQFVKEPAEQELLSMYYAQSDITLYSYERIKIADTVCEACDICGKGYQIKVIARGKDFQKMTLDGWEAS